MLIASQYISRSVKPPRPTQQIPKQIKQSCALAAESALSNKWLKTVTTIRTYPDTQLCQTFA